GDGACPRRRRGGGRKQKRSGAHVPDLHRAAGDRAGHGDQRHRAGRYRHLRAPGASDGFLIMIGKTLIALAAAAIFGALGSRPAAADPTYHEHNETARYTIDITYPIDYPDMKAVSDFVN